MKCPKCGHEQVNTVECEACGIFFEKYRQRMETQPELTAIRTPRKQEKPPPYKLVGAVLVSLVIILVFVFTGGNENKNTKPVKKVEHATPPVQAAALAEAQAAREEKYRYYKELTGYNLDRTLLRFQPTIGVEYGSDFNFNWIRAYNCEYASKIQQDKLLFREIEREVMDEEIRHRNAYPTKYQHKGDIWVQQISKDRGVILINQYVKVKAYQKGASANCEGTQAMNTRHTIKFAPFRQGLRVDVPTTVLQKIDFQGKSLELEIDIKFRIEGVTYKPGSVVRTTHQAVIEEMAILNNDNAPRNERIFVTLRESQLY